MDAGAVGGVVGPAGMPRNIVVKLNESINQAVAAPDVLARFASLNMEPMTGTPEGFASFINETSETWAKVLKRANLKSLD